MTGSIDSWGIRYPHTPTADSPVWLVARDYTKEDIDNCANKSDYMRYSFTFSNGDVSHYALLRYEKSHHPREYIWLDSKAKVDAVLYGFNGKYRNPNGMDLKEGDFVGEGSGYVNSYETFRRWWANLSMEVEDDRTAEQREAPITSPKGRADLLRQLSSIGVIDAIQMEDIPAALEILKEHSWQINTAGWLSIGPEMVKMLKSTLVGHRHLMDAEQRAEHPAYVPPSGTTTGSGTA